MIVFRAQAVPDKSRYRDGKTGERRAGVLSEAEQQSGLQNFRAAQDFFGVRSRGDDLVSVLGDRGNG